MRAKANGTSHAHTPSLQSITMMHASVAKRSAVDAAMLCHRSSPLITSLSYASAGIPIRPCIILSHTTHGVDMLPAPEEGGRFRYTEAALIEQRRQGLEFRIAAGGGGGS